ncbi:MAG: pyruvate kinase [Bacteroidota bacterium]
MKINVDKITGVIGILDRTLEAMVLEEEKHRELLEGTDPMYKQSSRNLIHYNAFRRFDLRSTQKRLKNIGLTRFANAEGHIKASVVNTRHILLKLLEEEEILPIKTGLSIKRGKRLLNSHTKLLLGNRSKGRRVRIMVTQPTEAAFDKQMVYNMVQNGMNCARVNCAHDSPEVWEGIINNVREAAEELGQEVQIAMDLAGPKIRTSRIVPGPKIKKFTPEKDLSGRVVNPAKVILVPEEDKLSGAQFLPVPADLLDRIRLGDKFRFTDSRDKKRKLIVVEVEDDAVIAHSYKTAYIKMGTLLHCANRDLEDIPVGELPAIDRSIILKEGEVLRVVNEDIDGRPAVLDEAGNINEDAVVGCQLPQVFERVKAGEKVLFDDGKIEGVIENTSDAFFEVRITRAREKGSRLKAEKGMNFPNTDLGISGLTSKDREDLKFVAQHADIVNFSFVNSTEDVRDLYTELEQLQALNELGVILKIETGRAFDNLTEILLEAMRVKHVGVMIARGDLAVETGWDRIGRVQEEILALCGAAHIPVVWATQVLENLAKTGLPSRSEITDATTSLKAECVMLNKGPYINQAISLLHTILSDMEAFHEKKEAMLPKMQKS